MTDLIKRLEETTAHSRELDKAVWLSCGQEPVIGGPFDGGGKGTWEGPLVTHNTNAALVLSGRLGLDWTSTVREALLIAEAHPEQRGEGALARFVCIAILKATDTGRE